MQIILFRALLLFIALGQCHAAQAVTWRTFGCDGWTFKGASIGDIWDNAHVMATNAQSQISVIPTSPSGMINTNARRAGANAKFLFGITFKPLTGTDSAGTATMAQANNVYTSIQAGLEGHMAGGSFNINNAFLFCGGDGLTRGTFPGNPTNQDVWYAEITTNGVTEYIILQYAASANWPRPCTEAPTDAYIAKTFTAIQVTGTPPVQTQFTGIILCPNQLPDTAVPTLTQGFTPAGDHPNPDQYISLAGTLVHEMAHVVGRSKGTQWGDQATLFNQCVNLANTNSLAALINPDNYRVFAEMSMSPATKWEAPAPA